MTAADVIAHTGISYRRLSYYCERGFIPGQPKHPGTGNPRDFTPAQVLYLQRLARLIDAGIHVEAAVGALTLASETPGGIVARLTDDVRVVLEDRSA